jgi:hypothetical protein
MDLIINKTIKAKIEIRFIIELLNHIKSILKKMIEKLGAVPDYMSLRGMK